MIRLWYRVVAGCNMSMICLIQIQSIHYVPRPITILEQIYQRKYCSHYSYLSRIQNTRTPESYFRLTVHREKKVCLPEYEWNYAKGVGTEFRKHLVLGTERIYAAFSHFRTLPFSISSLPHNFFPSQNKTKATAAHSFTNSAPGQVRQRCGDGKLCSQKSTTGSRYGSTCV
jgi:hypothetical protein